MLLFKTLKKVSFAQAIIEESNAVLALQKLFF